MLGGRIPKGVLLVGPPGTGKTLLAKAIAGEAGVPFFSLSGSDFVEMFVGVGAARVRDMFQQAEAKAPCIIFIDELDALGKTRGSEHRRRARRARANAQRPARRDGRLRLQQRRDRDGRHEPAGNARSGPAAARPFRSARAGRSARRPRPRGDPRRSTCRTSSSIRAGRSEGGRRASRRGFVGADLANLVNEAALLAARKGKTAVGMDEFNEGVERVTAGLEKKQRIMHEDEKQRVAYHESGHALVAYSLPNTDPVHKVSIIPRGLAALGYTMQRPEGDRYLMTQGELESRIQVLLAGTIAEEMIFDDVSTGAQNDLERATEIARSMVMDFGMSRLGRVNYPREPPLAVPGRRRRFAPRAQPQRADGPRNRRGSQADHRRIAGEGPPYPRSPRRGAGWAGRAADRKGSDRRRRLKQIIEENSPSPLVPGTGIARKRAVAARKVPESDQASGGVPRKRRSVGVAVPVAPTTCCRVPEYAWLLAARTTR